ncbi:MAG TPA: amylo-alpha-1,6-glucosidase [Pyrinomonadaceae bacterium]
MIQFGQETCANLDGAGTREWLETNGLGGFSSSTITGLNTRRYHGLLVAATEPPVGRTVMLSKLEETLVIDGRRFELSTNQYPGVVHPQGYTYQTGFRLDPFPVFTYRVEGIEIEKSLFMLQGENSVAIRYTFRLPDPNTETESSEAEREAESNKVDADETAARLSSDNSSPSAFRLPPSTLLFELRPLVAFRDYHSLAHENGALDSRLREETGLTSIVPYEHLPALYFAHDAEALERAAYWYRSFEYERERERGFDFSEDLFSPFVLRFDLKRRARASLIASTERRDASRLEEYRQAEIERRRAVLARSTSVVSTSAVSTPQASTATASTEDDEFVRALVAAADQFVVARGARQTVLAGYHWFGDWGRDTMIALAGLTLVTARFETARSILKEFARHTSRGMLPNRFPDDGGQSPDYNTVDATLWFFEAARAYLQYSDDAEFVRAELYDVLVDIIAWHVRGTRFQIRVERDGLLASGEEGAQLTWMDAKVGDWVVTPRHGKPVEIQALWYNALRIMENFAREFADKAGEKLYGEMAAQAAESFNRSFWNEEHGCLYDVIDADSIRPVRRDASIRPNQILAVSLHYSMLTEERARGIVETVERELLTPYGLRSLSPHDPDYRGRYEGDSLSRDGAYHQGTVWAWLIGPFVTAYLKIHGETTEGRARASRLLEGFRRHLCEAGLGQISEIFDGDPPHTPRGCIAQAWSVAELLRVSIEENDECGSVNAE